MSLKPPKKGDLNKSWMSKRRNKVVAMSPEYHLIVTEGTDTEPAYFNTLKEIINGKYRGRIRLDIFGEGDNTLSLFEKARRRAEESLNIYKHVWIVYDTDDFPAEHIDKTAELCNKFSNEDTSYHAIWSNQCIELWFLLHFSYLQSDLCRSEYWPKLTDCFERLGAGKYKKNRSDIFTILQPYMSKAIRNAKKLDAINHMMQPSKSAPGTKVFELVEVLRPYM